MGVIVCLCAYVCRVVEANPKCYIGTIHCLCEFITYRALSLLDAMQNRALRCKYRVRRILSSSMCSKRRNVVQNNSKVESNDDEDLNS